MEAFNDLNKLHSAFPQAVQQNEAKIVKLAQEISREILQDVLSSTPEFFQKAMNRGVVKVSGMDKVFIKVNPLDLDSILPKQEYFKTLLPDVQDFIISGHYAVERGGCIIEASSEILEAQINTQLAVIEELFSQVGLGVEEEVYEEYTEEYNPEALEEEYAPGDEYLDQYEEEPYEEHVPDTIEEFDPDTMEEFD